MDRKPADMIDQRYEVLRLLGKGNMGVVYKVKDRISCNIRALKIINTHTLEKNAGPRFKKEFFHLTQLRHPNLTSVYDFGTIPDGRHYYTMEYVAGANIKSAIRSLTLDETYDLIVQICRALQYIHARSIIHLDIKPTNILVFHPNQGSDGQHQGRCIKLVDFGLAGSIVADSSPSTISGTLPYIAPEIIKGLGIDHRADLYSLGVVLYELLTKCLPITGKTRADLIRKQVLMIPEPPRKHNPRISRKLESLILRLLEKEPAQRFFNANEIIVAINAITHKKFALETTETIASRFTLCTFIGRGKELSKLNHCYDRKSGVPRTVLIAGESGVGKSRLLNEFRYHVQLEQGKFYLGNCSPYENAVYHPFLEILRQASLQTDNGRLKHRVISVRNIIAGANKSPDIRDLVGQDELSYKDSKMKWFSTINDFFNSLEGRIVIAFENLHWLDDTGLELMLHLMRNLRSDICIIATYCTEQIADAPALAKFLELVAHGELTENMRLSPLDLPEVTAMMRSNLNLRGNIMPLARRIYQETGGYPFLLQEVFKDIASAEKMSAGQDVMRLKYSRAFTMPSSTRDILLRRLRNLSTEGRELAKVAAIIGHGIGFDLLRQVSHSSESRLPDTIQELLNRQILVEKRSAETVHYDFALEKLREIAYATLSKEERSEYHQRMGAILEKLHAGKENEVSEELSDHFFWSSDRTKAFQYSIQAGIKAARLFAIAKAIMYFQRALDILDRDAIKISETDRIDLYGKMGNMQLLLEVYNQALIWFRKMLKRSLKARDKTKEIDALIFICMVYQHKGQYKKALVYGDAAFRKAVRIGDKARQAFCNSSTGLSYQHLGRYQSALSSYQNALTIYSQIGDKEGQAKAINGLGVVNFDTGKTNAGLQYYQQALELYETIDDLPGQAKMNSNIGILYSRIGDHHRALVHLEKGLDLASEAGRKFTQVRCLYTIANVYNRCLNKYRQAMEKYQDALEISEHTGDQEMIAHTLNAIGDVHMTYGFYSLAMDCFRRFYEIARKNSDKSSMALGTLNIGSCHHILGDYQKAIHYQKRSLKISQATGYRLYHVAALASIAMDYAALGKYDLALVSLRKSLKILEITKSGEVEALVIGTFADIHIARGNLRAATDYTQKMIDYGEKSGNRSLLANAYLLKCRLLDKNDYINTRYCLSQIRNILADISNPEIAWQFFYQQGIFFQNHGKFRRALDSYGKCLDILRKICSNLKDEKLRQSYVKDPRKHKVFMAIREIEKKLT